MMLTYTTLGLSSITEVSFPYQERFSFNCIFFHYIYSKFVVMAMTWNLF